MVSGSCLNSVDAKRAGSWGNRMAALAPKTARGPVLEMRYSS